MHRVSRVIVGSLSVVVPGAALTIGACSSNDSPPPAATTPQPEASAPPPAPDPTFGNLDPTAPDDAGKEDAAACVQTEAQAERASRPVDVIFVIDNSESMSEEIAAVEDQINTNLVAILEAAKIDYRVIMLSAHGSNADQKVCVKAPLSGTSCDPIPPMPVETARFFHHSVLVGSNHPWCVVINAFDTADQYNLHPGGYGSLLRSAAFKVFIVVTDDRVATSCKGQSFDDLSSATGGPGAASLYDTFLTNLHSAQFGTPSKRNYVWHSIVGMSDYDPTDPTKPAPPDAPIKDTKCSTAFDIGSGYQALSIKTGGLRFPTCGLDYTAIFSSIANSAITGSALECEFQIPDPPPGETLDLSTVVPEFKPSGGGAPVSFEQVEKSSLCGPDKFFIENKTIKLCPASCDRVKSDLGGAEIKILYGCNPKNSKPVPK
jgi:hypothetical protein